jgi:hypothetical protein
MAKTLGAVINAALKDIKEPEITEFTSTNILEQALIEEANNAKRDILSRKRFNWGLSRTTLTTSDDITTGTVAVTNGSTTVTSKDDDGVAANNFGSVAAGMYIRVGSDKVSYKVTAVDTDDNPDTLTIETAYVGTTSTSAEYTILKDEYGLTTSDLDNVQFATFSDGQTWFGNNRGSGPNNELGIVDMPELLRGSGGDLHRNTSGKPQVMARIIADSSDRPVFKLWPYPTDQYVIDLWYSTKYSENTTFATNLFGGDAPDLAYDAVEYRVCARAQKWDRNYVEQQYWMQQYQLAIINLIRGPTTITPNAMSVATYRRSYGVTVRAESQVYFDTKPAYR